MNSSSGRFELFSNVSPVLKPLNFPAFGMFADAVLTVGVAGPFGTLTKDSISAAENNKLNVVEFVGANVNGELTVAVPVGGSKKTRHRKKNTKKNKKRKQRNTNRK